MRKVRWTFNLPNFQGRYLKQGTVGTYSNESLPNITGTVTMGHTSAVFPVGSAIGCFEGANTLIGR